MDSIVQAVETVQTVEPDMLSNIFNSLNSVIERQNYMINMLFVFLVIFCLIYIIKFFLGIFMPFTKL